MADRPEPTATATLRVIQPGARADEILAAVAVIVDVEPQPDGTHRLTFRHASPRHARGVLSAHLSHLKMRDWQDLVSVSVDDAASWPFVL